MCIRSLLGDAFLTAAIYVVSIQKKKRGKDGKEYYFRFLYGLYRQGNEFDCLGALLKEVVQHVKQQGDYMDGHSGLRTLTGTLGDNGRGQGCEGHARKCRVKERSKVNVTLTVQLFTYMH